MRCRYDALHAGMQRTSWTVGPIAVRYAHAGPVAAESTVVRWNS